PADGRGIALRDPPAPAEDPARRDHRALMPVKLAPHVPKTAPNDGVIEAATAALGAALIEAREHVGEITLVVQREAVVDVCRALRDTPGLEYQQLMDIAAVDYPDRAERFDVNYCLLSLTKNRRIVVK